MAEYTEDQVVEAIERIKSAFADGFQIEDVKTVIKEATAFTDLFTLERGEAKALATRILEKVIDETDTPWLPDDWTDPLLKRLLPGIVDLVLDLKVRPEGE